jgi:hypothetical protein
MNNDECNYINIINVSEEPWKVRRMMFLLQYQQDVRRHPHLTTTPEALFLRLSMSIRSLVQSFGHALSFNINNRIIIAKKDDEMTQLRFSS